MINNNMTKFDTVISELTNLPAINPTDATNKLAAAFKSLPKNVSDVVAGIGGALSDATESDPDEAMLIDKLKNPTTQWTSDDRAKLEKFLQSRGLQSSNQQQQVQQKTANQQQQTPNQEEKSETPSIKSSTTYGGKLQGL